MEANYTGTLTVGVSTTMYNGKQGYNKNGNMGYLKRTTGEGGANFMDQWYSYSTNQLTAGANGGDVTNGFKHKINALDYTYDTAGNMVTDANKGLTLSWKSTARKYLNNGIAHVQDHREAHPTVWRVAGKQMSIFMRNLRL